MATGLGVWHPPPGCPGSEELLTLWTQWSPRVPGAGQEAQLLAWREVWGPGCRPSEVLVRVQGTPGRCALPGTRRHSSKAGSLFLPGEGLPQRQSREHPTLLYMEGPPLQRLPEEGSRPALPPQVGMASGVGAAPKVQVSCRLAGAPPAGRLENYKGLLLPSPQHRGPPTPRPGPRGAWSPHPPELWGRWSPMSALGP